MLLSEKGNYRRFYLAALICINEQSLNRYKCLIFSATKLVLIPYSASLLSRVVLFVDEAKTQPS
jgi:hypothetical protein